MNPTLVPIFASALAEPLEVVGVVTSFSFFYGGVASAAELLRGASGADIANAAARGAAAGFIIGLFAGLAATLYLLLS
jgi:hypothetical protein